MKRYLNKSKFIIIILTILFLFISILAGNIIEVEKKLKDINMAHSDNAVELSFSNYTESEIIQFFSKVKQIDGLIIKYYFMDIVETQTNEVGNIMGIYFDDTYNREFKMKSGRFLNEDDFKNNSHVAVIGSDIEKYTVKQNDKQYIIIGNDEYEVIGIIDGDNRLENSDYIFYNLLNVIDKEYNIQGDWWIVDSNVHSRSEIYDILNKISQEFGERKISMMSVGDRYDSGDSFFVLLGMIVAFVLTIVVILCTLIGSIRMWIDSMSLEIGVRFTSGARRKEILYLLVRRYFISVMISLSISNIVLVIISTMNKFSFILFKVNFTTFILSFLLGVVMGMLTIPIISKKFNSFTASVLLKEGR